MQYRRRPVLLLEVIIAAFLVALVAAPLLRPSVALLLQEKKAISALEEERALSRAYAVMMVALYRGEIGWSEMTDYKWHPLQGGDDLGEISYRFVEEAGDWKERHTPKGEDKWPKVYEKFVQVRLKGGRIGSVYPVLLERKGGVDEEA